VNVPAFAPIAVVERDGAPWVEWCDLSGVTPDDPFFEQTVARALAEPDRRASRRRTPLAMLTPFHRDLEALAGRAA
jgi:hypothetical protein